MKQFWFIFGFLLILIIFSTTFNLNEGFNGFQQVSGCKDCPECPPCQNCPSYPVNANMMPLEEVQRDYLLKSTVKADYTPNTVLQNTILDRNNLQNQLKSTNTAKSELESTLNKIKNNSLISFITTGNNGTCPCDNYCAKDWAGQIRKSGLGWKSAKCAVAYIVGTNQPIGCNVRSGKSQHCVCVEDNKPNFMERGNIC